MCCGLFPNLLELSVIVQNRFWTNEEDFLEHPRATLSRNAPRSTLTQVKKLGVNFAERLAHLQCRLKARSGIASKLICVESKLAQLKNRGSTVTPPPPHLQTKCSHHAFGRVRRFVSSLAASIGPSPQRVWDTIRTARSRGASLSASFRAASPWSSRWHVQFRLWHTTTKQGRKEMRIGCDVGTHQPKRALCTLTACLFIILAAQASGRMTGTFSHEKCRTTE